MATETWFGILDTTTGQLERDKGDTRPYLRKLPGTARKAITKPTQKVVHVHITSGPTNFAADFLKALNDCRARKAVRKAWHITHPTDMTSYEGMKAAPTHEFIEWFHTVEWKRLYGVGERTISRINKAFEIISNYHDTA